MKNKLKNAGVIAAAMLLCMSFASCQDQSDRRTDTATNDEQEETTASVTEVQSDTTDTSSPASDPSTQPSYSIYDEPETEPTYYHVALEGAVVTEQDRTSNYTFVYKCEFCGKTRPGSQNHSSAGGTYHGSFLCNYCREIQQFRIQTERN